jgi:hypothetical protein
MMFLSGLALGLIIGLTLVQLRWPRVAEFERKLREAGARLAEARRQR